MSKRVASVQLEFSMLFYLCSINLKNKTMKKIYWSLTVLFGLGFMACTNQEKTNEQTQNVPKTENKMKNLVSIIEIPTNDFARAVAFYKAILNVSIEEIEMAGTQMGLFPSDGETVNVALVKGSDYKPTMEGVVVYLNAGNDLQPTLDKILKNGGTVIVPKTEISPEMGFYALFVDSEGNKVGLHSSK
jgi:predicted enzyme related to lactoylglutathione lyase